MHAGVSLKRHARGWDSPYSSWCPDQTPPGWARDLGTRLILILWGAARAGTNTLGVRITDVRIHKQTVDLSKAQAADRYTQKYTCTNYSASSFSVFTALTQEWKVSYNLWLIQYVPPSNPLSLGASYSMHQTTNLYSHKHMKNKAAERIGLHSWLYTAYSPNSECSEGKYDFLNMHLPKLPTVNIQL